jgi:hypothetical protein
LKFKCKYENNFSRYKLLAKVPFNAEITNILAGSNTLRKVCTYLLKKGGGKPLGVNCPASERNEWQHEEMVRKIGRCTLRILVPLLFPKMVEGKDVWYLKVKRFPNILYSTVYNHYSWAAHY